jgi:hypothetical protein
VQRGERRSASRPTRRREQVTQESPDRAQPRDPDSPDRYIGPLRRRDDLPDLPPAREPGGADGYGYGRGPGPGIPDRSDETIQEEICDLLAHHPDVDAGEIEVLVEGGEVTLQGSVEARDARWLVEELVVTVTGVSLVHNRVRIARR